MIDYFDKHQAILKTHRGFDLGALDYFKHLKPLADFSSFSKISRLLIELNRSLHHKNLFSEFTKELPLSAKKELIAEHYLPYRNSIENEISKHIHNSKIDKEKQIASFLKETILSKTTDFRVRYNYPYLGKMDGFTTYLRKQFPKNYVGIEIEINQKYAEDNNNKMILKNVLFDAISTLKTNNFL